MFSKRVLFFETDYINIQCSLYIFDLKWNYISNVHFPVSPCCYFTLFEIITARNKSPLHLDRRFWKISPILEVKDNLENFEIFLNFWNFSKFWKFWKFHKFQNCLFFRNFGNFKEIGKFLKDWKFLKISETSKFTKNFKIFEILKKNWIFFLNLKNSQNFGIFGKLFFFIQKMFIKALKVSECMSKLNKVPKIIFWYFLK